MLRAFGFAILFAVVGLIAFALIAPLILRGGNMRGIGAAAFPIILLVGGGIGFVIGLRRRPNP